MTPIPLTVQIKVLLTLPVEAIMAGAAEVGEDWGRDRGWKPANLNEAIAEIILWTDNPQGFGVQTLSEQSA
jgi:hypothetical protein